MPPTSEKASEKTAASTTSQGEKRAASARRQGEKMAASTTKQGEAARTTKTAATTTKAAEAAKARCEQNAEAIDRITHSIDVAQSDLTLLRGSIGTGMRDLRRDLSKLLRDARRDVTKMGVSTKKDIERLQKDLSRSARPHGDGAGRTRRAGGSRAASKRTQARRGD